MTAQNTLLTPGPESIDGQKLTGRNRRLLYEWKRLEERVAARQDFGIEVAGLNAAGLPTRYLVTYLIRSICGVERLERLDEPGVSNEPVFATTFRMAIDIPEDYPCIDSQPAFRFLTHDEEGNPIPHPWHPNIRYFGDFAGRVCLNVPDSYMDLAWYVERIASYLRYDRYHARQEPPYPEDMKVARWVMRQGEPMGWIAFD